MISADSLVTHLLEDVYTTASLKQISDCLEELAQDKSFKAHTGAIVTDDSLTDKQKQHQLLYLIKSVDQPNLYNFFSDILSSGALWIFSPGKIDYFDKFVQEFQMATESIGVLYLTTAIELSPSDLKAIAQDLSKAFGYQTVVDHVVNPAIIGGAQVRIENFIYDFSIRSKFQQFQRSWVSSLEKTDQLIGRNQE